MNAVEQMNPQPTFKCPLYISGRKKTGLTFQHVCEVGVFEPETFNVLDFVKQNIKASLVEADPDVAKRVADYFVGYSATVYPVAIWDTAGVQTLARVSASTFVVDLKSSPTLENDNYQIDPANTFEVEGVVFSTIDLPGMKAA